MKSVLVIMALLGSIACASTGGAFSIKYECIDIPSEQRIEMRCSNDRGYTICLLPEFWPNAYGRIDAAPGSFVLVVGQQRFPIEKRNMGYCPKCAEHVPPGKSTSASIPYASFHLPESLKNEKKHIEFVVKAFRCKQ
jgi:hypothetical protein